MVHMPSTIHRILVHMIPGDGCFRGFPGVGDKASPLLPKSCGPPPLLRTRLREFVQQPDGFFLFFMFYWNRWRRVKKGSSQGRGRGRTNARMLGEAQKGSFILRMVLSPRALTLTLQKRRGCPSQKPVCCRPVLTTTRYGIVKTHTHTNGDNAQKG